MTNLKNLFIAAVAVSLAACAGAPSADKAATTDKQSEAEASGTTYSIDTTASSITWVGTKPTGQHTGTMAVSGGNLSVADGKLTSGSFTINVNSLSTTDLEGEGKMDLDGHLKSPDFFDAGKYPTATFTVTSVEPFDSTKTKSLLSGATHLISGNLKLKDSTKNVTFPAKVDIQANGVTALANFNIDRRQWGMHYGSDASIQDKFIRPDVNIQFNVKANK